MGGILVKYHSQILKYHILPGDPNLLWYQTLTRKQVDLSWEQIPANFLTGPHPIDLTPPSNKLRSLRNWEHNSPGLFSLQTREQLWLLYADYNSKALEILDDKDTSRPLPKDPTLKYKIQLINLLKSCETQGQISQDTYKILYPTCASTP